MPQVDEHIKRAQEILTGRLGQDVHLDNRTLAQVATAHALLALVAQLQTSTDMLARALAGGR